MPALPLLPHPSAAPPAAAALPFELACEDGPPTAEDFADALNVAKNAALDVLVLALSGRTDEGLPTRDALFAAARILAHSAHHDRLAAARRPSAPRARQHKPASGALPQLRAIERTPQGLGREHQSTAASPTKPPLPPPTSELLSMHPRPGLRGEEARTQHEQVRGVLTQRAQDPPRPPPSPSHIRPPASQIRHPPSDFFPLTSDTPLPTSNFDPCDFLELDELLVHGPAP